MTLQEWCDFYNESYEDDPKHRVILFGGVAGMGEQCQCVHTSTRVEKLIDTEI